MDCSDQGEGVRRREFLQAIVVAGCAFATPEAFGDLPDGAKLDVTEMLGELRPDKSATPIAGAAWFTAEGVGDGFAYRFHPGALQEMKYLTTDMLLDGDNLLTFSIALQEGENGRTFHVEFGGLPQCSYRVRLPMGAVDQHQWVLDREAGFLKPQCMGDRVELGQVDRIRFTVFSKRPGRVRWCMTPLAAVAGEVEKITRPALPQGKLLDELGQSRLLDWPGKSRSVDEVNSRIASQWENASKQAWPEEFSRWGGWKSRKLTEGKGFFRTYNDGKRWWLVDPDGYAFWSAGVDCVTVEETASRYDGLESALAWLPNPKGGFQEIYQPSAWGPGGKYVNFLTANLIRALGPGGWRNKWAKITLAELKRLRFNTVGNWSNWEHARAAGFPYVRPMEFRAKRSGYVFRDFPDVYHPEFAADAAEFAMALSTTADDPAFIGYFLMNEPTWGGFSSELPPVGMLYSASPCSTRSELVRFLKKKYPDEAGLATAWKMPVTFAKVEAGRWQGAFTPQAENDLRDFAAVMVEQYFNVVSTACRKVDPHHLNLGIRYNTVPPVWAVSGMKFFDVFSMNCYAEKVPHSAFEQIHGMLRMPIMIGEYHFGSLDVGLPASGVGPQLATQSDRGRAYRIYLEDAAVDPHCVGVHWFQMYDQSAIGRPDGECYNIGFFDVCNRPYPELGLAAIMSHERMYPVAAGSTEPFRTAPEYLPHLSL